MTGFGVSELDNDKWSIRVELKSLNNKFLEINMRLPKSFKEKEMELRQYIGPQIQRGSVSIQVTAERKESAADADAVDVNMPLAMAYHRQLTELGNTLQLKTDDLLNSIIAFPDVVRYEESGVSDEDWQLIKEVSQQAFKKFDTFRLQEGDTIEKYLIECVARINDSLSKVALEEAPRKESLKSKLLQSLLENREEITVDENRFEQEMIFYLEKYDIAEEKSRLGHHIEFFLKSLKEEGSGKKLNFIAQEMGREINTMGSKAYHFPIQQNVVLMKEELEKIKEQLLNVL